MIAENGNQQKIVKYRKLFGITESDDLSALKAKYAVMHEKIQAQIRSKDTPTVQEGHKNRQVLEKAFTAVANEIRTRELNNQSMHSGRDMSIEHASVRVGFQVLERGGKFISKKVTSFAGVPTSFKTNNILNASWPVGKLNIFNDHLDLNCLLGSFQVKFCDIAAIEKAWYIPFSLRVRQKDEKAESVHIFGWGLGNKLKDIVRQNHLPLKLNY